MSRTSALECERHPPRVPAMIRDRQAEHREGESEPARESQHRGRERACAFGRLLDCRDRGDRERRVDERARQDLEAGQRRQARRRRRRQVGEAQPDDADEQHAPTSDAVRHRRRDERDEHAGPRHRERAAEPGVGRVERVGDEARVLAEQPAAEAGDRGCERGGGEQRGLAGIEVDVGERRYSLGRRGSHATRHCSLDALGRVTRAASEHGCDERADGPPEEGDGEIGLGVDGDDRPVAVGRDGDAELSGTACVEGRREAIAVVAAHSERGACCRLDGRRRCVETDDHPAAHGRNATAGGSAPRCDQGRTFRHSRRYSRRFGKAKRSNVHEKRVW